MRRQRHVARQWQGDVRGPVQAQREHLAQFLANGRVLPEQAQPVVVRREAAKVWATG